MAETADVITTADPALAAMDSAKVRLAGVRAGVPLWRGVAAADVAALQADAQMQPLRAGGEAVLAALHLVGQLGDLDLV